jgi:hypothetical protein
MGRGLFDLAVCTIFAREFMEGAIIVGNFRTVIQRSNAKDAPVEEGEDDGKPTKQQLLKCVTCSAFWAAVVAVLVVLAIVSFYQS